MNAKKYLIAAILLNVVLLAVAASFWPTKHGNNEPSETALNGLSGKFGPAVETVLPITRTEGGTDILNLETGRALLQRPLDFDSRADAIMAGIRSNGLDISCSVWPGGAACITYDMTVVPAEGKAWEETTEAELFGNPALSPRTHSPRRLLVMGHDRPDIYLFRTGEGTLGMLQLVGPSQDGQGVNIRYRLVNPSNSLALAP